jgi:hypothetical protein
MLRMERHRPMNQLERAWRGGTAHPGPVVGEHVMGTRRRDAVAVGINSGPVLPQPIATTPPTVSMSEPHSTAR